MVIKRCKVCRNKSRMTELHTEPRNRMMQKKYVDVQLMIKVTFQITGKK